MARGWHAHRKNLARLGVALVAVALVLELLLSAIFLVKTQDHDCAGDGCAVCLLIKTVEAAMSSPADTPAVSGSTPLPLFCLPAGTICAACLLIAANTPVTRKERLVI